MSDIVKHHNELSTTVDEEISKSPYQGMKIGSIFISKDGKHIRKIVDLKLEQRINWDKSRQKQKDVKPYNNYSVDKENEVYEDVLMVYCVEDKNWEATEWSDDVSKYWIDGFDQYRYGFTKLEDNITVAEYFSEASKIISGEKSMKEYQDSSMSSSGTDLIHMGSKEHLEAMTGGLEAQKNKAQLIQNFISRELEKQKDFLDNIKREMGLIVQDFNNKIEKINKVIHTIELYMGINEDIIQIQKGDNASTSEPICFRQQVLFMDEEVGDPRIDSDGQGLDFRSIETFDDWLSSHDNYKKVMPESKGVLVFRVRREKKQYSDNPFINHMMNEQNMKTYILIRNGDNLYRIWADINITRLFPKKSELMDLQINTERYSGDDVYNKGKKQEELKKISDLYIQYQKQIILLQGLIDRTDIFKPLQETIKLTDPAIHDTNLVRFIYDDELALGDGRKEWNSFLRKVNSNIGIGSRVVVGLKQSKRDLLPEERYDQRYATWRDGTSHLPDTPNRGMYVVEKYNMDKWEQDVNGKNIKVNVDVPCLRYNPNDTITNPWDWRDSGHTRKNRITFRLQLNYDWEWMVDVDNITIKEIDYYLDSRIHRRHYLRMMPVLWEIRKVLVKELEEEKDFVKLMAGILYTEHANKATLEEAEDLVWDGVKWWKTKNKWKRALNKDESKALRMIINKLKKEIK